jgi:23S rRNA (uracil1939-C5)-methyltransferase
MGRKKKKIIKGLTIESIGAEGQGIARNDGKVIFVEGGIPGDVADILIHRNKKGFGLGTYAQITTFSPMRQEPFCQHFGICGGCRWQHLQYEHQVEFKQQIVVDAFERIGKLAIPETKPILSAPINKHYRNKLEYTFSDKRWLTIEEVKSGSTFENRSGLGFHKKGAFDKVVDIETCHLQDSLGDEIRNAVRKYALENNLSFYDLREGNGFLRNLTLRNNRNNEWMLILSVAEKDLKAVNNILEHIHALFPQIVSFHYVINTKANDSIFDLTLTHWKGEKYLVEQLGGLDFNIGPKSFFQTNPWQAENLYKKAVEMAGLDKDDTVYDLYTGTGTIGIYMAGHCQKVIGIDNIDEAILDANTNAKLNKLDNIAFHSGDMKDILNGEFMAAQGKPDVIITDPPRAGMHKDVVEVIRNSGAGKLVYISCNPATQARDLALLKDKYELMSIQPVDMFPHTFHIENIALLTLRTV